MLRSGVRPGDEDPRKEERGSDRDPDQKGLRRRNDSEIGPPAPEDGLSDLDGDPSVNVASTNLPKMNVDRRVFASAVRPRRVRAPYAAPSDTPIALTRRATI